MARGLTAALDKEDEVRRMMMTRRTALLAGLGASVAGLAACSSKGSSSATASSSERTGTASDPVKLTFWAWVPNIDKVVAIWNKAHPEIQVTVQKQDGGDPLVTKYLTAITAGSGAPDIVQAEYQKIPTLVAKQSLADISGVGGKDLESHFSGGVWSQVVLGGDAVYGIPQDTGPMAFYYRADVFDKLQIPVPATWDDYATAAQKIHEADSSMYLGTFSSVDPGEFAGLSQQAGAQWWSVDTKNQSWGVTIDSAATRKVAQFWGDLVQKGYIDNTPQYTTGWYKALNTGKQVGWVSAAWAPGTLSGNAGKTVGKWKVATLPQWSTGTAASGNWGGSAIAVSSQSKYPRASTQFITWLNTTTDAVKALVQYGGIYPADNASAASVLTSPPEFFSNQPDFYSVISKSSQSVQPFTFGPNVNVAYQAFQDSFGAAAESKQSARFVSALSTMQTKTIDDLKKSGFSVDD